MTSILLCAVALAAAGDARPTVAVLPPAPADARSPGWLGLAIADGVGARLLIHSRYDPQSLQRIYPFSVFSWRQASSAARGEGFDPSKPLADADLAKVGRQLGTDYILTGSYKVAGETAQLAWRLVDARNGSTAKYEERHVPLADVAAGVDAVAAAVTAELGESPKALGGHQLAKLSVAALAAFGEGLAIVSHQSLDPRARLVLPKEEMERAHALFVKATTAAPEFTRAWVERGVVSAMLGDMPRAESELVEALARGDGFDPATALGLFYIYDRQGNFQEGIQVLVDATTTHLGFLHGLGYLGSAYLRSARSHDALTVFTTYVARVPRSPWARVQRAAALARIGQHAQAIEETETVLGQYPASIMVKVALASRYIDATDWAAADKLLTAELAKHPEHPALLTRLSYVEIFRAPPERALGLAQRAVAKLGDARGEPLAGYAHLNLGHALALLGKRDEAFAAWEKAVQLGIGPDDRLLLVRDDRLRPLLSDPHCPLPPLPTTAK